MSGQQTAQNEAETRAETKAEVVEQPDTKATLYAAYDLTYLKFIGGTADTKAKVRSQQAYKDADKAGHDLEIREV